MIVEENIFTLSFHYELSQIKKINIRPFFNKWTCRKINLYAFYQLIYSVYFASAFLFGTRPCS